MNIVLGFDALWCMCTVRFILLMLSCLLELKLTNGALGNWSYLNFAITYPGQEISLFILATDIIVLQFPCNDVLSSLPLY